MARGDIPGATPPGRDLRWGVADAVLVRAVAAGDEQALAELSAD